MIETTFKTLLGITAILSGWLLVQAAWRRVFPGTPPDEDALADRIGCHNCRCLEPCENARQNSAAVSTSTPQKG